MSDNWVLIANPAAGRGQARPGAEKAARTLENSGQTVDLRFTRERGHAAELACQAVREGAARLIVCGGDGTLSEVLPGLAYGPVALGLLPCGTGNDFARSVGISRRFDQALRTLLHGQDHILDLARVDDHLFCTVAAFGFDAEVSHTVNTGQAPFPGTLGYLHTALKHLSRYQPPHVRLSGEFGEYQGEVLLVATGNTSSYGGGLKIVPTAHPQDGKLDVCIAGKLETRSILNLLPRVFWGGHLHHPAVRCERTSWLKIETAEPRVIHADGEHVGETPVTLRSEPAALTVVLPSAPP